MIKDQQLSRNFRLHEFLYKATAMPSASHELMKKEFNFEILFELSKVANQLQTIRDFVNVPLVITCGFRPIEWDKNRGRSGKSTHCKGQAADFFSHSIPLKELFDMTKKIFPYHGVAMNKTQHFIHFDTYIPSIQRGQGRRWEY